MKLGAILILVAISFSWPAHAGNTVLLYTGTGATTGDIDALETQLSNLKLEYDTANSEEMGKKTQADLQDYTLLVWPGGDSIAMGKSFSSTVTADVLAAVKAGLNYIGFCAGSFMAEDSSEYNTIHLASTWFNFYDENAIEVVTLSFPSGGGEPLPVVYWNGPVPVFGDIVAKYPNGDQAVGEGYVDKGYVILSGVHPEAPTDWDVSGYTSQDATNANAYARTLIDAAYKRTSLKHF